MRVLALLAVLTAVWPGLAENTYIQREHHVSTQLDFKIPDCLTAPDNPDAPGYAHTDAMFGMPFQRNRVVSGLTYYMTPNKTQPGCGLGYGILLKVESAGNQVFLIDRGSCTFGRKVREAQNEGAEAVIIANHKCLQSDYDLVKKITGSGILAAEFCCADIFDPIDKTSCELQAALESFPSYLPFMASDTADSSIKIPAVLITKSDARKLKEQLCKAQPSIADLDYCKKITSDAERLFSKCEGKNLLRMPMATLLLDTPHPDNRVEYELWMSSENPPEFLNSFYWFSHDMRAHTWFTPRYIVVNGTKYNCSPELEDCGESCIYSKDKKHAFCNLPEVSGVTGAAVLEEDVRQYCIWKQENATFATNGLPMWWSYIRTFANKKCISQSSIQQCSSEITSSLSGLNAAAFQECVQDRDNILYKLSKEQEDMGVFSASMIVNSRVEHFSMTSDRLSSIICDGFAEGTAPAVCSCVRNATNTNEFLRCKECEQAQNCDDVFVPVAASGGIALGTVVLVVLLSTSIVAVGAFVYTRHAKRQMHSDVRNILAEYMPLDDVDMPSSGRNGGVRPLSTSDSGGVNSNREDVNLI